MLGFQHIYAEIDDLALLKQMARVYFERYAHGRLLEEMMIGVLIWNPGNMPPDVKLPWTLRQQPELFPLMLVGTAWMRHPDQQYKPWYEFGGCTPTYTLQPTTSYGAIDQFLRLLDHYLELHDEVWREAWQKVREPHCDGSIDDGYTLSAGNFRGPLVIGRKHMEYHK